MFYKVWFYLREGTLLENEKIPKRLHTMQSIIVQSNALKAVSANSLAWSSSCNVDQISETGYAVLLTKRPSIIIFRSTSYTFLVYVLYEKERYTSLFRVGHLFKMLWKEKFRHRVENCAGLRCCGMNFYASARSNVSFKVLITCSRVSRSTHFSLSRNGAISRECRWSTRLSGPIIRG